MTWVNSCSINLELLMLRQKASARRMGRESAGVSPCNPCLASAL